MFRKLLLAAFIIGVSVRALSADKIDRKLAASLSSHGKAKADVVVSFAQDTSAILNNINQLKFSSRGAKITTMKAQLEELQKSSQANALQVLSKFSSIRYRSLWVNNKLYVQGATSEVISALAEVPEVVEIREEIVIKLDLPSGFNRSVNAEWNIEKIEADQAWALPGGNDGAGIVVCE